MYIMSFCMYINCCSYVYFVDFHKIYRADVDIHIDLILLMSLLLYENYLLTQF